MYRSLENNLVPGFHYYDCHVSQYISASLFSLSLFGVCLFAIFHFQTGSVLLATNQPFPTKINIQEKKNQKSNAAFLIVNIQLWTLFVRCLYRVLDN